jgi:hypothetical protein
MVEKPVLAFVIVSKLGLPLSGSAFAQAYYLHRLLLYYFLSTREVYGKIEGKSGGIAFRS